MTVFHAKLADRGVGWQKYFFWIQNKIGFKKESGPKANLCRLQWILSSHPKASMENWPLGGG
jgi:hypothetical protein